MRDLCKDQWTEVVWPTLTGLQPVDYCDLQLDPYTSVDDSIDIFYILNPFKMTTF